MLGSVKSILERLKKIEPPKPVEVPGTALGEGVYVRAITGEEYDTAIAKMKGPDAGGEFSVSRSRYVAIMLCSKDGDPVLDVGNPDDVALIGRLDNKSLQALFDKALELNGASANPTKSDRRTPSGGASNSA